MLSPSGRFETGTKICLSISSFHPESWQPSWSVRSALIALIAFMQTPGNGAVGSLDVAPEIRRQMATEARNTPPKHANAQRQELINTLHQRMLDGEERSRGVYKQAAQQTAAPDASPSSSSPGEQGASELFSEVDPAAAKAPGNEEEPAKTPLTSTDANLLPQANPQTPGSTSTPHRNDDSSVSKSPHVSNVDKPSSSLTRPLTTAPQIISWEDRGLTYASVILGILIALVLLRKLLMAYLDLRVRQANGADEVFSFSATSLTDIEL
jgi:ubiquitin-conjugating enzyme E2 J1